MDRSSSSPSGNPLTNFFGKRVRVVDLSHTIHDHLPQWPGDTKSFEAQPNASIEHEGYFTRSFWMLEHYGTHLDAPAHFAAGKMTVDEIPAERLMGPAVVLEVRGESKSHLAGSADYRLPVEGIKRWETAHGPVPAGAIVLLRTGCASHWLDADRYRGLDSAGGMHFPGFSAESVQYLISKQINGIGADSMWRIWRI
jgi:kynurenine formamidase